MAFGEANRTGLRVIEESTFGVTPAGPVLVDLPYTGESLKSTKVIITDETIRSDANIANRTNVGGGADGDIAFNLRYGDFETLITGLMRSTIIESRASVGVCSSHFSGAVIEADTSAFAQVVVGQHIKITSATTAGNNGIYRVDAVSTTVGNTKLHMVDHSTGAASTFTSEIFGATTRALGRMLRNGVTQRSYSIEKAHLDVGEFFAFTGMRVGGAVFSLEAQSNLTGSFSFLGKNVVGASATVASTVTAQSTNDTMQASDNVNNIWTESSAVTTACFRTISFNINNNLREQAKVGSSSLAGIAYGTFEVTGALEAYFEDRTQYDEFLNGTAGALRTQIQDTDGNAIIITVPKVRFTDGEILSSGLNTDNMVSLSYGAMIEDSGLYTMQIDFLDKA